MIDLATLERQPTWKRAWRYVTLRLEDGPATLDELRAEALKGALEMAALHGRSTCLATLDGQPNEINMHRLLVAYRTTMTRNGNLRCERRGKESIWSFEG